MNRDDEKMNMPTKLNTFIGNTGENTSFSMPEKTAPTSLSSFTKTTPTLSTTTKKPVVAPTTLNKPKDDSFIKTTQLALGSAITTSFITPVVKAFNSYSDWFYDKFNKGKNVFGEDNDVVAKNTEKKIVNLENKITEGIRETIGEDRMNSYLYQSVQGVGQGIAQIGTFAVNPVLGYTTLAGQMISAGKSAHDDAYQGMIKNGATEQEAKRIANINGNIVGTVTSLEAIPVLRAMGITKLLKKPISNATKSVIGRILKEGLIESSTEAFQEAVQSETARQTWNKEAGLNDTLMDTISSFLVSIPAGLLFGGAGEIQQIKQNHLDKAQYNIQSVLENETDLTPEQTKTLSEFIVNNYAITAKEDVFSDNEKSEFIEFAKKEVVEEQNELPAFQKKENDITTKILKDLEGKTTVSKQYILDATNRGDLKQVERELIRGLVADESNNVNVEDFTKKVQAELLPLKVKGSDAVNTKYDQYSSKYMVNQGDFSTKYDNVALPDELRGKVENYKENIYESPIETSAGNIHFNYITKNYFGHSRIEDMADNSTRRVIEVQSDLYQKGRLESEDFGIKGPGKELLGTPEYGKAVRVMDAERAKSASKLQQYNNPTAHFRMVREEIKRAAQDGKDTLLFPTGETAMKIEGLGETPNWRRIYDLDGRQISDKLEVVDLKIGETVQQAGQDWIITDVLEDGKFKAIPKRKLNDLKNNLELGRPDTLPLLTDLDVIKNADLIGRDVETFDISGKIDTNNPIYRFYEKDLAKYLKQQYQATPFTDDLGVTWNKVEVKPEYADAPIMAFKKQDESKTVSYKKGLQVLKEAQNRLGLRFPIAIYQTILTGEVLRDGSLGEAYGMYLDNKITLSEFITKTTAQHELGHLLFRNLENIPLFKGITREQLYIELRNHKKEWNNLSKYELEERLMEMVEQYSIDIQSGKVKKPKTTLEKIVANIYNALREILGLSESEISSIEKFLDTMYFGKSNKVITLYDSNKTSDFMQARFKEFGEDINELPVFQKKATIQEVEKFIKVATQRTTQGKKTAQQIKKELFPGKDKLTITEQAQIKNRLKEQEKGFNKGFQTGKKLGITIERENKSINRKQEIKQFNERIMRRLYKKTLLEELRNLPKTEWNLFTKQIADVDISEVKYLNTLSKITNRISELEVENGKRKILAMTRRDIGFLRHLYDINPVLVRDIKKKLNIRDIYKKGEKAGQFKDELKHIKDYSLEELNMFKSELKNRIAYRQSNPVKYFNYVTEKEDTFFQSIKEALRDSLDTIERTLNKINPALSERMNTYYFDTNRLKKIRLSKIKEFIEIYAKADTVTQIQIKKASLNGEIDKLTTIMESISDKNPQVVIEDVRTVMDELFQGLKNVGLDVKYLKNYFPRALKPLSVNSAELMVAQMQNKFGEKILIEERESIITNLIRGFNFTQSPFISISGKRFESERLLEFIDDNIDMYEDPATALIYYIAGATNLIEQRKLFGKSVVEGTDYDSFLKNSITKMIHDQYEQGLIKQKDINTLKNVFNTLFVPKTEKPIFKFIRKFTSQYIYPLTLGQFSSTLGQSKDLSLQILMNDVFAGQMNTFTSFGLTPEMLYMDDSIMKLEGLVQSKDSNVIVKFLDLAMKPFGYADQKIFLRIAINSSYQRLVKTAKQKNNKNFQDYLKNIFGNRYSEVLNELKSKNGFETQLSADLQRIIWGEIARIRPLSDLQKTQNAIKYPAFYVLKNFMIKQLQFVRSESFDYIARGYKKKDPILIAKGMSRLVVLMAVIGTIGGGVDEVKDWILGKSKNGEFQDNIINNLLGIVGMNNYMISMGKQKGFFSQMLVSYTPAAASVSAQIGDDIIKDINSIKNGDFYKIKSYRRFPIIGNIIYQRFGN